MNTYSRVLKHIDMKGVKQKHQQKIIEKRLKEDKKKEEEEYIQSVMENKKCDWRKELNEMMTTADVFFTTLPATGDTTLEIPSWNAFAGVDYSISDGTATITAGPESGFAASFDTSLYDTLVLDVNVSEDSVLGVFISATAGPLLLTSSSGTYSIKVPQDKNQVLVFLFGARNTGTAVLNNLRFQRKTPLNVFVSLDSPEATSFIRTDPMMANLSPEERNKKLREMLEAGDEYVMKMLGPSFPGTGAVPPGDYDPFKQAPAGKAGDTPGVEVSDFDVSKMEKDYGEVAGYDPMYANIKSGQVPYMKPDKAQQLLSNPKYQKLWDDDPDALKTVQRLAGA